MSSVLFFSLISTIIISLFSLIGAFTYFFSSKKLNKIALFLVAFSTGALLGGAFLHLLPEATKGSAGLSIYMYLLFGIIVFYLLERLLKWHHCHGGAGCDVHTFTYMSLIGDGVHNFIDGIVIVSAFHVSTEVGIATSVAIASHEIPQELADIGVLIHGGFSRVKALLWNLMSALTAVLGVVAGYFLMSNIEDFSSFLLPFAAGGFVYISMSDLIPELHKEKSLKKSMLYFALFIIGLLFMYLTKILFE